MERVPLTPSGHAKLVADLEHLKSVVRPQIVKDIEEARAHGDLSENSEYEDAKERQGHCEARIRELQAKLAMAEVIDVTKLAACDRVVFGVTVEIEDCDTAEVQRFQLVGVDEADAKNGKISVTSPIGRALVGKEVGDEVTVSTPKGMRTLVINEVEYI